jgi:hypothetical protein
MFGQPSIRFTLKHRGSLENLPLHRAPDGDAFEELVRTRCRCGWTGPPRTSQIVASGDQLDHVRIMWNERK